MSWSSFSSFLAKVYVSPVCVYRCDCSLHFWFACLHDARLCKCMRVQCPRRANITRRHKADGGTLRANVEWPTFLRVNSTTIPSVFCSPFSVSVPPFKPANSPFSLSLSLCFSFHHFLSQDPYFSLIFPTLPRLFLPFLLQLPFVLLFFIPLVCQSGALKATRFTDLPSPLPERNSNENKSNNRKGTRRGSL